MNEQGPLTVAFRADASLDIGTGHVMRCLTLADALTADGATCTFVCREHPGHLVDHIHARGHAVHALPAPASGEPAREVPAHARWLGADWETDARQTAETLTLPGRPVVDWLVVDHYALDARWEGALRGSRDRLLAIDDLADRPHACDLLLDQNLGRDAADYAALVPEHCRLLVGPRYALLRPEFAALRESSLRRRAEPALRHLLITMGGVDRPNATGRVLEALPACPLPADCRITVVVGARSPWRDAVRAVAATLPWRTEVLADVADMARLMAESDLAIGAAGGTALERCCLGLPSLLVVLADNQRPGAAALESHGAARLLGDPAAIAANLPAAIAALLTGSALADMSRAAGAVTQGRGTAEVAGWMRRSQ